MKVAIVGGAPSSEMLAPFEDTSWEIWVLGNRAGRYLQKRITRIFEIHENLTEHGDPTTYAASLVSLGYPLVTGETFPVESPLITRYPYTSALDLYGDLYLTSSPAYMLAYALLQGALEIGIYGVDLSVGDHEYFWQRPCMEAWIGFAKGRGVRVHIPEVSHIGKSKYVEGRDWNGIREAEGPFTEEGFNAIAAKHQEAKEALQAQRQELALRAAMYDGAEQVYKNLAKVARAVDAQIDVKSLLETTVLR